MIPDFSEDKGQLDTGGCFPRFYLRAVQDTGKSEQEGRPIYKSIPYVAITLKADPYNIVDRAVTEQDKMRFRPWWDRFQQEQAQAASGTPIDLFPPLSVAQVAELKAIGIKTVEALAESEKKELDVLRTQAKDWLKGTTDGEVKKLRAEVKKLTAELEQARSQLAQKAA